MSAVGDKFLQLLGNRNLWTYDGGCCLHLTSNPEVFVDNSGWITVGKDISFDAYVGEAVDKIVSEMRATVEMSNRNAREARMLGALTDLGH